MSSASISAPAAPSCISAANNTPEPSGRVRTNAWPRVAPASVIAGESSKPVTENPKESSAPMLVWPPTISAPLVARAFDAPAMISPSHSDCNDRPSWGNVTVTNTAWGDAPMAQTSPIACSAAICDMRYGSVVNARTESVVSTWRVPENSSSAASSPGRLTTSARVDAGSSLSGPARMSAPTLAPHPPHNGGSSSRV